MLSIMKNLRGFKTIITSSFEVFFDFYLEKFLKFIKTAWFAFQLTSNCSHEGSKKKSENKNGPIEEKRQMVCAFD